MAKASAQLIEWKQAQVKVYDNVTPWNRQPFDTDGGWAAFRVYLMVPLPRTVDMTRKACGTVSHYRIQQYMKDAHWKLRAAAFDNHVHATWQKTVATYIERTAKDYTAQHVELLNNASELAGREIKKYLDASKSTPAVGLVRVGELTKLISVTITLGRLVHGESTANLDISTNLDNMSVTEIKALKALQEKAKAK